MLHLSSQSTLRRTHSSASPTWCLRTGTTSSRVWTTLSVASPTRWRASTPCWKTRTPSSTSDWYQNICVETLSPATPQLLTPPLTLLLVLTGGAEHQASVLYVPLADPAAVPGIPPARRHPDLGHPVLWQGPVPLPDPGLLCYAYVRMPHVGPSWVDLGAAGSWSTLRLKQMFLELTESGPWSSYSVNHVTRYIYMYINMLIAVKTQHVICTLTCCWL